MRLRRNGEKMYNFFVEPSQIQGNEVRITGSDVNHIKNVLRMRVGEELSVSILFIQLYYRPLCRYRYHFIYAQFHCLLDNQFHFIPFGIIPYEMAEGMEKTKGIIASLKPGQTIAVFIGPEGGFEESLLDNQFHFIPFGQPLKKKDFGRKLHIRFLHKPYFTKDTVFPKPFNAAAVLFAVHTVAY